MQDEIEVAIIGLGPMGKLIGRALVEEKGLRIVGAIDYAQDLVGKDLGLVLKLNRTLGL